jgi:hypothetical protein
VATPAAPAPQAKLAATFLGPLLAGGAAQAEPRPVCALLAAADADARVGDFEGALSWLAIVERLDFVIPTGYVARREEWRRNVDPGRRADPAADRLEGRFATAAEALSDLERRVGWLREAEARTGGEMRAGLEGLDQDLERLKALSRRTGIL